MPPFKAPPSRVPVPANTVDHRCSASAESVVDGSRLQPAVLASVSPIGHCPAGLHWLDRSAVHLTADMTPNKWLGSCSELWQTFRRRCHLCLSGFAAGTPCRLRTGRIRLVQFHHRAGRTITGNIRFGSVWCYHHLRWRSVRAAFNTGTRFDGTTNNAFQVHYKVVRMPSKGCI